MGEPLVSIVIPAWNAEEYVKEAVRSALAQTYPNIEIVVVDDGSTDGTKQALEEYSRDPRCKYIYQANKGLAGARNTGIRESRGRYIAFLDSDDMFAPDKIKDQVTILEGHPDFGVCYSDLTHFTDTDPREYYHHRYTYPSGDILESLLHRQFVNPLTLIARRSVIDAHGMFNESFRRSEDWELWLRWAHAGVKFYYLDKPLAYYRMRNVGNLSSIESEPAMKEKNLELFTRFGEELSPEEKDRYRFEAIILNLKMKTALAYLMVGNKDQALAIAQDVFWGLRLIIYLLPASMWRFMLGSLRRLKHRLLLRKI